MIEMPTDPDKEATVEGERDRAGAAREDAKPESERTIEEAVRRSMSDLEQEGRKGGDSN